MTVHSDSKFSISDFDGRMNILSANRFDQGCSLITVKGSWYDLQAHAIAFLA